VSELAAVAITLAKPGCENKLSEELEALIEPTRREAGMLQYEMHRDIREPRYFVFVERWKDEATFNAHCNSVHVAAYLKKTKDWVERSELRVLTKVK
jgi:quinol monooxygenase YgiN